MVDSATTCSPPRAGRVFGACALLSALIAVLVGAACFVQRAEPAPPPPPPPPGPEHGPYATVPAPNSSTTGSGADAQLAGEPVLAATDVGATVVKEWGGYLSLIPFQTWPEVPGRAVGLLMASGQQPWGGSITWTRGLEHGTSRTEYRFLFDRSSPYAVYFVSDGRGFNYLKNWSVPMPGGGTARHKGAAMFRPDTPNDFGLGRKAHLVEVEANGGRGGAGIHFVITDARVLDGSESYPLRAEETLIGLRERFDAALARFRNQTSAIVQKARASLAEDWTIGARGEVGVAVWPTWIDEESAFEVVFVARLAESAQGPEVETMRRCPPCRCTPDGKCPPCVRCDPEPIVERPSRQYGFEMAAKYRVDRHGRLVSETIYAPRAF